MVGQLLLEGNTNSLTDNYNSKKVFKQCEFFRLKIYVYFIDFFSLYTTGSWSFSIGDTDTSTWNPKWRLGGSSDRISEGMWAEADRVDT